METILWQRHDHENWDCEDLGLVLGFSWFSWVLSCFHSSPSFSVAVNFTSCFILTVGFPTCFCCILLPFQQFLWWFPPAAPCIYCLVIVLLSWGFLSKPVFDSDLNLFLFSFCISVFLCPCSVLRNLKYEFLPWQCFWLTSIKDCVWLLLIP